MTPASPGWYPDPDDPTVVKYWTGSEWTSPTPPPPTPPPTPPLEPTVPPRDMGLPTPPSSTAYRPGGSGGYPAGGFGYQPDGMQLPMGMKPDNYLVWAILSTLLCCLPLGIVSIVYSAKVDGLYAAGQYLESQSASDSAKKWAVASVSVSLILIALYFLLILVAGALGTSTY